MPQYVIERTFPGVGGRRPPSYRASPRSPSACSDLDPDIEWLHSYVVDEKIYCVYHAPDAELVREHARCGGFPADSVSQVHAIIDPTARTTAR